MSAPGFAPLLPTEAELREIEQVASDFWRLYHANDGDVFYDHCECTGCRFHARIHNATAIIRKMAAGR